MLCTVQCRPASACARKSPPRGCTLKKQDKTRQDKPHPKGCNQAPPPAKTYRNRANKRGKGSQNADDREEHHQKKVGGGVAQRPNSRSHRAGRQARFRIMSACGFLLPAWRTNECCVVRLCTLNRGLFGGIDFPSSWESTGHHVRMTELLPPSPPSTDSSSEQAFSSDRRRAVVVDGCVILSTHPLSFSKPRLLPQYSTHAGQTKARASSTTDWVVAAIEEVKSALSASHTFKHTSKPKPNKRRLLFRP